MKVAPFHSVAQTVHHEDTRCADGERVTREQLRLGTGGKPLCPQCAALPAK